MTYKTYLELRKYGTIISEDYNVDYDTEVVDILFKAKIYHFELSHGQIVYNYVTYNL